MREVIKFVFAVLAIVAIVLALLRVFFMDEIIVTDDRMAPTILSGERVLLWRGASVDVGDIVVCANPSVSGQYVMGRVIGLAGARIDTSRGGLRVNGRAHDRDWRGQTRFPDMVSHQPIDVRWGTRVTYSEAHEFMSKSNFVYNLRPTQVAAGRAYLLADFESSVGTDSRAFGAVDVNTCLGEVFMRLLPQENAANTEEPFDHGYLDLLD